MVDSIESPRYPNSPCHCTTSPCHPMFIQDSKQQSKVSAETTFDEDLLDRSNSSAVGNHIRSQKNSDGLNTETLAIFMSLSTSDSRENTAFHQWNSTNLTPLPPSDRSDRLNRGGQVSGFGRIWGSDIISSRPGPPPGPHFCIF